MSETMLFQNKLSEVRAAAEKIDAALLAVQSLADAEPQEFPTRERITKLREISRTLAQSETALIRLFA